MTITTVDASADLAGALKAARPGDVIFVAAGAHPKLSLYQVKFAAPGVIVRTAPGAAAAASLAGVQLVQCAGIAFEDLDVTDYGVMIQQCDRIAWRWGKIAPSSPGNYFPNALMIRSGSTDIVVDGVEITGTGGGCVIYDNAAGPISVLNSHIHDLIVLTGNDAFDIFSSSNVEIGWNTIHDLFLAPGSGVHLDSVQVDSPVAGGQTSTNVLIHDNLYFVGTHSFTYAPPGAPAVKIPAPSPAQGIGFVKNANQVVVIGNASFGSLAGCGEFSNVDGGCLRDNFCSSTVPSGARIVVRNGSRAIDASDNVANGASIYVTAAETPPVSCTLGGNSIIAQPASNTDTAALAAWLAAHPDCGSSLARAAVAAALHP